MTLPWKMTISTTAMTARKTMPRVKASRSPRNANRRGRKRSRARMLSQPREVGEGGVGGQHQEQGGRDLDQVVVRAAVADQRARPAG